MKPILCCECPETFIPTNPAQKACATCRPIRDKRQREKYNEDNKERLAIMKAEYRKELMAEGAPAKVEPYQPKPKPLLITDSEQRLIDRYCDSLDNETLQCKVYQPGSGEFARVAAEIMSAPHNTKIVDERLILAPMQLIRRRYAAQQEG